MRKDLENIQGTELFLQLENHIDEGITSMKTDGIVEHKENKNVLDMDVIYFFGWAMSQIVAYEGDKLKEELHVGETNKTIDTVNAS